MEEIIIRESDINTEDYEIEYVKNRLINMKKARLDGKTGDEINKCGSFL